MNRKEEKKELKIFIQKDVQKEKVDSIWVSTKVVYLREAVGYL